ncbi:UNVERIFIED_CONTAM: hypothetical protein RMT77_005212 [Armadillidium vulgare]
MTTKDSPKVLPQYATTFCATLGAMAMGAVLGYTSPVGPILTSNSTDIIMDPLTPDQNSWFSSVVNLGALAGCPLAGFCINYFGRRTTIIFSVIPVFIGWVLIISAQNFPMLIVGRLFSGIYCSIISLSVPTYVAEFASPHIRGTLGGGFQVMVVLGILFAYCMGPIFDSFRWIGSMCAIIPCICSISMIFVKESPSFLVSVGKENDAEEALKFFRGKNFKGIEDELSTIKRSIEESKQRKASFRDLKKNYILKPFLMSLGLMFFQQFSGINAVLFNLNTIFEETNSDLSADASSIIVAVVQFVACLICMNLTDKAGRKILLSLSSVIMIISLIPLGLYFYFDENNTSVAENITWLPLVSLMVFIFGFSIGFGPIPWLMMGELFSPEIKELSASIATMANWTFSFIVTVIFSPLQELIYDYGVYWMFSGFVILSLIFVVTFVYETKGKTLQEINEHFGGPRSDLET